MIAAGQALDSVAHGQALDQALRELPRETETAERAAAQDIAYTACRRLNLLDALAARLLAKPNPALDGLVRAALSELISHPERAHAVVDQAVTATAGIKRGAFKGVVNAVLRRFLREREALLADLTQDEALRLHYPAWWIARLRTAYPEPGVAEGIMASGNQRPPMTLRVNRRRADVEGYLATLAEAGLAAVQTGPDALRLERPMPVARLPGFGAGEISVQDLGAQYAAHLLDVQDGMRVLDACAAPGGKTAHILEAADCELLALDRDAVRLKNVTENLARLGLSARCEAADAAKPADWWDGKPFDRVLLDAPCTASGIIRRHPDGKWLKRATDLGQLATIQRQLLDALWQVLRPGGKLLYATCSVFPEENARQIEAFLSAHANARALAADLPAPYTLGHRNGQLLPDQRHDGFYYALLEKA
ncbi:MAG: ribosomal small subunit methyltransferase RsmB [Betaproteobacteria bacterium]|nr:ribosomal small subunit methyltransferase RsmB [Betaproteobacteria bacterium]